MRVVLGTPRGVESLISSQASHCLNFGARWDSSRLCVRHLNSVDRFVAAFRDRDDPDHVAAERLYWNSVAAPNAVGRDTTLGLSEMVEPDVARLGPWGNRPPRGDVRAGVAARHPRQVWTASSRAITSS